MISMCDVAPDSLRSEPSDQQKLDASTGSSNVVIDVA